MQVLDRLKMELSNQEYFTDEQYIRFLMENMMCEQMEKLDSVMGNMTLSARQQQKLYKAAKDRINHLLGGEHSPEYKENAKSYFINLWNGLKSLYGCASYNDLNPKYYDVAFGYISAWEYVEA